MSRVYEGQLLYVKSGERKFTTKSTSLLPGTQDAMFLDVYYEKVTPHLGRELFTQEVFPILSAFGTDKNNKQWYRNNSIVDAAAVIVEDKEWGLVDDKDELKKRLEDFMYDPDYRRNVEFIRSFARYNQPLSEAIRKCFTRFGTQIKEGVKAEIDVNTMGSFAKKMVKSHRK